MIDTGLNILKLKKRFMNYRSVFCTENSIGFDIDTNNKKKYMCSFDYKKIIENVNLPRLLKYLPKKIIINGFKSSWFIKISNF